jgi:two-component system sensor histidine kinase KdpD
MERLLPTPTSTVRRTHLRDILVPLGGCTLTTGIAQFALPRFELSNIIMLYLLTVVLCGSLLGRTAALLAALTSVGLFDFFFVPPRYTLSVEDWRYLPTFAVMLAVALITGQMAAWLRQQAADASRREHDAQSLYRMAQRLAAAMTTRQALAIVEEFVRDDLHGEACVLSLDEPGPPANYTRPAWFEPDAATACLHSTTALIRSRVCYLPLHGSTRMRGVLAVHPAPADDGQRRMLDTAATLSAQVLERLHYVEVARRTELQMQNERLRSSILSALSHDLRTPLTALVGLSDTLLLTPPALSPRQHETATALHEQSLRISEMVTNLLELARLDMGDIALRREWQPLEEVIGASIKLLERALAHHPVRVALEPGLPFLEFDAVLLERVFCNLLENAAKYAPPDSPIEIMARRTGEFVRIEVQDHGPGVPEAQRERVFDMFVRGTQESTTTGAGLGLAICRAIVTAHGGDIHVEAGADGGALFCFTLPVGSPPELEETHE